MEATRGFIRSSIGRKVVMAVTGVILVGFVIAHMLGNLQVYIGPDGTFDFSSTRLSAYFTMPASTASGNEMFPTTTTIATTQARTCAARMYRGCDTPSVWNMLQTPCFRWRPSASIAKM